MSELIQNLRCSCCKNVFIIALKIKEKIRKLKITCPYCGNVEEINGTKIISVKKG